MIFEIHISMYITCKHSKVIDSKWWFKNVKIYIIKIWVCIWLKWTVYEVNKCLFSCGKENNESIERNEVTIDAYFYRSVGIVSRSNKNSNLSCLSVYALSL